MHKVSEKIIKNLYSKDFKINFEGQPHLPIPEGGSLGLLALGYKGLIAWRKSRGEAYENLKAETKIEL